MADKQEPGFRVPSPCGRVWFVPLEAVAADYADFLVQNDGLSPEDARRQVERCPEFLPTWFAEQCCHWVDVERMGRLEVKSTLFKTKAALDRRRGGGAIGDYEEIGIL